MRSLFAVLRRLTIPAGSPPGSPRLDFVSGADLPADLRTYYTGAHGITTPTGAIIFYQDDDRYQYLLWGPSSATSLRFKIGVRNPHGIREALNIFQSTVAPGRVFIGYGNTFPSSSDDTVHEDHPNNVVTYTSSLTTVTVTGGATLAIDPDGVTTIDGFSAPRGYRDYVSSTASTAAIGAETIALTSGSIDFVNGRAYEVIHQNRLTHSAAQVATMRVRKTNLAGASLLAATVQVLGALTASYTHRAIIKNTSGADITAAIVLTLAASAGTVTGLAGADTVRYLEVRDVGAAADYPNANTIT